MTKGSDLLVAALENEGVERIFGIPGEENLDVVESLRESSTVGEGRGGRRFRALGPSVVMHAQGSAAVKVRRRALPLTARSSGQPAQQRWLGGDRRQHATDACGRAVRRGSDSDDLHVRASSVAAGRQADLGAGRRDINFVRHPLHITPAPLACAALGRRQPRRATARAASTPRGAT